MTPALITNLITACVLAGIRIAGHKSEVFQAVAHLYVGGLFAWSACEYRLMKDKGSLDEAMQAVFLLVLAVVLSLIELFVAIWQRM